LYTEESRFGMREMTQHLLEVFGGPEHCELMWLEQKERGWKEFLDDQRSFRIIRVVKSDWKGLRDSLCAKDVLDRFPRAQCVIVTLRSTAISDALYDEISASVPESLRNECIPCGPSIQVGWHDVWECAMKSNGQYLARAFVSIHFFSYDTPNGANELMAAIGALPVFREFKTKLENVTGPLKSFLIQHV